MKLSIILTAVVVLAQTIIRCAEAHTIPLSIYYDGVDHTKCHYPTVFGNVNPLGFLNSTVS